MKRDPSPKSALDVGAGLTSQARHGNVGFQHLSSPSRPFPVSSDEDLKVTARDINHRARVLKLPFGESNLLEVNKTYAVTAVSSSGLVRVTGIKAGNVITADVTPDCLQVLPQTYANTINFPCQVIAEESYRSHGVQTVFRVGYQGYIKEVDKGIWQARVVFPGKLDPRNNTLNGWIRVDKLKIGTRLWGSLRVRYDNIQEVQIPDFKPQTGSNLSMASHFFSLFTGLLDQATTLHLPAQFSRDMGNVQARVNHCHDLAKGVHRAGLTWAFNQPRFTESDILSTAKRVNEAQRGLGGVYARRYSNFKPDSEFAGSGPLWYIGKTSNFKARDSQYKQQYADLNDTSTHAGVMRAAQSCDNMILIEIANTVSSAALRTYGETAMMCLLQTWRGYLLQTTVDLPQGTIASDAMMSIGTSQATRKECILLREISRQAAQKSHWPGAVLDKEFGAADGMNHNCPLTENLNHERIVWTRVDCGDRWVFCRTPLANFSGKFFAMAVREGETWKSFDINHRITAPDLPPIGTKIWVSWELMKNNADLPAPYFRAPEVSPWEGGENINSLAFKVVYQKDGHWFQNYVQSEATTAQDKNIRAGAAFWNDGFGMINFFKRQVFHPHPPTMQDYGVSRLVEPQFDWLSQTITVKDVQGAPRRIPNPRMKSDKRMCELLESAGLHNAGWVRTNNPGDRRKRCDGCRTGVRTFINKMAPGHTARFNEGYCRYTYDPQQRICDRCFRVGLPCTFTEDYILARERDAFQGVFLRQPENRQQCRATPIPDPRWHKVEI